MTEDEAKTKACCGPFAGRLPYGDKGMSEEIAMQGLDPDYAVEIAARWPCIGSACMAWRWSRYDPDTGSPTNTDSTTHGGCGLAGAPL